MRLIDADALIENVRRAERPVYMASPFEPETFSKRDIIEIIDRQPAIDAIMGVRCGKCAYWDKESIWCGFCHEQKCHNEYCYHGRPEKRWERFTWKDGDEQCD